MRGANLTPMSLVALVLCVALGGCAPGRYYFRPTEKVVAESLGGFPAAEYEISLGGKRAGEARIWSAGTEWRGEGSAKRAIVLIGFEVESNSDLSLALTGTETTLRVIRPAAKEAADLTPEPPVPELGTAPHQVQHTLLAFPLPEGVRPQDLEAFRVHWVVHGPEEQAFQQHTAFVRLEPVYPPYWYYPYPYYGWPYWYGYGYGYRYGYGYPYGYGPYWW
jgi:hypothetical protein